MKEEIPELSPIVYGSAELLSAIDDAKLKTGAPIAFIFCTSNILIEETIEFHFERGFRHIFLFVNHPQQVFAHELVSNIVISDAELATVYKTLNRARVRLRGNWLYWGFNAEFFVFPFFENRTISDLADFLMSEQRLNIFSMTLDLYSSDLSQFPDGASMENASFDIIGYFSEPNHALAEILDEDELLRAPKIMGGLRKRYEEFLPASYGNLARTAFFFVDDEINFDENGICERPNFHTISCEHHHNTTGTILSFQTAIMLRHQPYSRDNLHDFKWPGSEQLHWNSPQLLRVGTMEPGQWF